MEEDILNISAHKYGNYHKYYDFHPAATRMNILDKNGEALFYNMWKSQHEPKVFRLLDVGCNEGDLSMDLYKLVVKQLPSSVKVTLLGIDLDSSLIDLANKKYASGSSDSTIAFKTVNCMQSSEVDSFMKEYFPDSDEQGFNFITYFSITMWIHLNHNDAGLVQFLSLGVQLLTPLGTLLVEPQPWKCYKAAVKRCRKLGLPKPLHYDDIKLRDIDSEVVRLMTSSSTSSLYGVRSSVSLGKEVWGRSLLLFHRCEYARYDAATTEQTKQSETVEGGSSAMTSDEKVKEEEHVHKRSKLDNQ